MPTVKRRDTFNIGDNITATTLTTYELPETIPAPWDSSVTMTYDGILGAYICKDKYGRPMLLDAEKYLDIELQLDEIKKKEKAVEEQTKKEEEKAKAEMEKKIEEESENPF